MAPKTGAGEKKSANEGRQTRFRIVLFSWRCSTLRVAVLCRWPSKAAETEFLAESAMLLKLASSRGLQKFLRRVQAAGSRQPPFFPCLSAFLSWAVTQVKHCVSESIHSRILLTAALTALPGAAQSESQLHMSFRAPMFSKMMVALLWPT